MDFECSEVLLMWVDMYIGRTTAEIRNNILLPTNLFIVIIQ